MIDGDTKYESPTLNRRSGMGNLKSCCCCNEHGQAAPEDVVVNPVSQIDFNDLCRALELTESEHDEHADTIRRVLKMPGFDVNKQGQWGKWWKHRAALHVACGDNIRSHVGAQLLLSDDRCDVNLQDGHGNTALMEALSWVVSSDNNC